MGCGCSASRSARESERAPPPAHELATPEVHVYHRTVATRRERWISGRSTILLHMLASKTESGRTGRIFWTLAASHLINDSYVFFLPTLLPLLLPSLDISLTAAGVAVGLYQVTSSLAQP